MQVSFSSIFSHSGLIGKSQPRSSGLPLPGSRKKLDTRACWLSDTASFLHVRFSNSTTCDTTDIVWADLANPLFACTGMKFWIYMTTVILSLPKAIIFVALGTPGSKSKAEKYAKVIAILVLVVITSRCPPGFSTFWSLLTLLTIHTNSICE